MNGLEMDEVRVKVKTIIANKGISVREAAKQIGCDGSRLGKFLKGELQASPRVLALLKEWRVDNAQRDSYGPIDEALEHLDKARAEIQAAKVSVDKMSEFLVKKIGSIVEMKNWLLGRMKL